MINTGPNLKKYLIKFIDLPCLLVKGFILCFLKNLYLVLICLFIAIQFSVDLTKHFLLFIIFLKINKRKTIKVFFSKCNQTSVHDKYLNLLGRSYKSEFI